jgi:molybdopterin/thiamine biosynthesis adenylyltransferase
MRDIERSVAMAESVDSELRYRLLRPDHQEDLTFALWTPSRGTTRETALLHTIVPPLQGDRQVHGNVSFNPAYVERVTAIAVREKCGVAFLHSHLGPGWQGMSAADIAAETKLAGPVAAITGLPLVGLTAGSDGTWSARAWSRTAPRRYERTWCRSVRVVGMGLRADFADHIAPAPGFREMFRRTITVWGEAQHANLARLRVGIVGLGSVGCIVAETLARMGLAHLALIDFDEVQPHNLDRLLWAGPEDVGALKIDVAARALARSSTAASIEVRREPFSVAEEVGYRAALDCDVLFSCVDRPRARSVLNHLAYAHLIPVVDGGIAVRFREERFAGVDWQLQTVAPGRPCLQCLGAFNPSDVSTERVCRVSQSGHS